MSVDKRAEIIEVLDCEIDVRPKAAPGFADLVPSVHSVSREGGSLVIEFADGVDEMLAAFVEAERLCCAGIGWEIEDGFRVRLLITATDFQLQILEGLWRSATNDHIEQIR